jgi:glycosyl transferase family 25
MQTFVISLKRTPHRLQAFKKNNPHFHSYEVFSAVDGLDVIECLDEHRDVFCEGLPYSAGAYGVTLSHKQLWEHALMENTSVTVCEDDVILHPEFVARRQEVIESLGDSWDFVQWGWNFDACLITEMASLSHCIMQFNQESLRANFQDYLSQPVRPTVQRLLSSFGICCYSISPQGALKFLNGCFPLETFDWLLPGTDASVPNYGIDVAMNQVYVSSESFVTLPPLAISLNEGQSSTIQS